MKRVYLDYSATTPMDPLVLEAMLPFFSEHFGNPSSTHRFGQRAEAAVDIARNSMAEILKCEPKSIIFTSGGTESDNLAIRGAALHAGTTKGAREILISPVEHPAVLNTARDLSINYGFYTKMIPVDRTGKVLLEDLAALISKNTAIVSTIFANNEIGTINPIADIARLCNQNNVIFHTDAVQAAGALDISTPTNPYQLLSLGAHKFYGPKGVGALICTDLSILKAIQTGGGQERGKRAGTENVPLIVGMAKAFELSILHQKENNTRMQFLRDHIIDFVLRNISGAELTGDRHSRLPNHASFVFPNVDGNQLVMLLDQAGFACSSGSACKTGNPEPSEVLLAIGIDRELASGSLRVSLGKYTTQAEVDAFLKILPGMVELANPKVNHV